MRVKVQDHFEHTCSVRDGVCVYFLRYIYETK